MLTRRVSAQSGPRYECWGRTARDYNRADFNGGTATDIIFLVERLEGLVAAGKKLPLTNNIVLDQAAVLELIDQLRVAVPDEVRQAKRITEEAGRITDRAREESDAIIARAQEQ